MSARYIPRHRRLPQQAAPDPRAALWAQVVVAIAQSSNSTRPGTMIEWADKALTEFDARFKEAHKPC